MWTLCDLHTRTFELLQYKSDSATLCRSQAGCVFVRSDRAPELFKTQLLAGVVAEVNKVSLQVPLESIKHAWMASAHHGSCLRFLCPSWRDLSFLEAACCGLESIDADFCYAFARAAQMSTAPNLCGPVNEFAACPGDNRRFSGNSTWPKKSMKARAWRAAAHALFLSFCVACAQSARADLSPSYQERCSFLGGLELVGSLNAVAVLATYSSRQAPAVLSISLPGGVDAVDVEFDATRRPKVFDKAVLLVTSRNRKAHFCIDVAHRFLVDY